MGRRRRGREYALQVLFQLDLTGGEPADVLEGFWRGRSAEPEVRRFAEDLVHGVLADRDGIDERIRAAARNWKLERMAAVDRNVLRLAVHELLVGDSPAAVVLDEAIEIARRFGSGDSGGFINGVLEAIRGKVARG